MICAIDGALLEFIRLWNQENYSSHISISRYPCRKLPHCGWRNFIGGWLHWWRFIEVALYWEMAALAAKGETIVNRVYYLDRGFERLEEKLAQCGATIQRITA
ncbi:hypothetical protein [Bartonella sp. B39]